MCALSCMISCWLAFPLTGQAADNTIYVRASRAEEAAKQSAQQVTVITKKEIENKQAKAVEDVIFNETGVSQTVDAMGRVGVSIRGAEARHTLLLVDGQPVMGEFAKFYGAADEVTRIGAENVERIEVVQGAASAKYGADAIGGVVNIITKKGGKTGSIQFNGELLSRRSDSKKFPFNNAFVRAESGQLGKLRMSLYGNKRDIIPVYASKDVKSTFFSHDDIHKFEKKALRYYGTAANAGVMMTYDINKNQQLDLKLERYTEDLHRKIKNTDSFMEPQQDFKRVMGRNTYSLQWSGKGDKTNWRAEVNGSRVRENDVVTSSFFPNSDYEGKNTLEYVDNIDHSQLDVRATFDTQVNDSHLLSYGFGMSKEKGKGSRLKNAPTTHIISIDPWEYDKSLFVNPKTGEVSSKVHAYQFTTNSKGVPVVDQAQEWYGYDKNNPNTHMPAINYETYTSKVTKIKNSWGGTGASSISDLEPDTQAKVREFGAALRKENPTFSAIGDEDMQNFRAVQAYYGKNLPFNGIKFKSGKELLDNKMVVGEAEISKQHVFVQDLWQVNEHTTITPIIRLDRSSLYGMNLSAGVGYKHNVGGNTHRRLKANIGTAYAEPGMGELYYNWEMYPSTPAGLGIAKMGWYWVGNPNLKPEKSLNFDLSYEGENKNTYARVGVFHNRIKDYLTLYFTGSLMDFYPELDTSTWEGGGKWKNAPDLIYSFKNIGQAEITGLEAEVKHSFGKHWKGRLGYTYLHAINKSDPNMPRQLLDKPTHKFDIGIDYEDEKSGWSGSLWGNYYVGMLDSNTIANNGNYMESWTNADGKGSTIRYFFAEKGAQTYEKKTYGMWNFVVKKRFNKDVMAYAGVNNIFNYRDDNRAIQERTYRLGVNLKFSLMDVIDTSKSMSTTELLAGSMSGLQFIERAPMREEVGMRVYGEYQMRWNSHEGITRPSVRVTADTSVAASAVKNLKQGKEHGVDKTLRLGLDWQISPNLSLQVEGTKTNVAGTDTSRDVNPPGGMSKGRLEKVDLTRRHGKWDFSIGRLHERMGVTGYWFDKTFDGARAVYTKGNTQVRVGYGDFAKDTGIIDSPYTRVRRGEFMRPPTIDEFIGWDKSANKELVVPTANENINFYQQLTKAIDAGASREEIYSILRRMHKLTVDAYVNEATGKDYFSDSDESYKRSGKFYVTIDGKDYQKEAVFTVEPVPVKYKYKNLDTQAEGEDVVELYIWTDGDKKAFDAFAMAPYKSSAPLEGDGTAAFNAWWDKNKTNVMSVYEEKAKKEAQKHYNSSYDNDREYVSLAIDEGALKQALADKYFAPTSSNEIKRGSSQPRVFNEYYFKMQYRLMQTDQYSTLPREELGKYTGLVIPVTGLEVTGDEVAPIGTAVFASIKKQYGDSLGVEAWTLQSVGSDEVVTTVPTTAANEEKHFSHIAQVFGVGARWQVASSMRIEADMGVNASSYGKYLAGSTVFAHVPGTSKFDVAGYQMGKTPKFYTLRMSLGEANPEIRGSWSTSLDYKYFEHGSFFGGNGTKGTPDRYLDGVKSFTFGISYVPLRNLLLEAFYTFDAQGLHPRDTMYGPENFKLGNYTRIQATYKF